MAYTCLRIFRRLLSSGPSAAAAATLSKRSASERALAPSVLNTSVRIIAHLPIPAPARSGVRAIPFLLIPFCCLGGINAQRPGHGRIGSEPEAESQESSIDVFRLALQHKTLWQAALPCFQRRLKAYL